MVNLSPYRFRRILLNRHLAELPETTRGQWSHGAALLRLSAATSVAAVVDGGSARHLACRLRWNRAYRPFCQIPPSRKSDDPAGGQSRPACFLRRPWRPAFVPVHSVAGDILLQMRLLRCRSRCRSTAVSGRAPALTESLDEITHHEMTASSILETVDGRLPDLPQLDCQGSVSRAADFGLHPAPSGSGFRILASSLESIGENFAKTSSDMQASSGTTLLV